MTMIGGKPEMLLSFYEGYDGPTLRIATESIATTIRLRELMQQLADGVVGEISLCSEMRTSTDGVDELKLDCADKREHECVRPVSVDISLVILRWRRTREGWRECVELLDAIVERPVPSHQYFTYGYDDVTIVFSFGE